VNPIG